jgi:DNA-binding GntR family transcriptional regulator
VDTDEINHGGGLPPYLQLAAILRRRIEDGALTRRLPSEKSLAQQYEVSESTVKKALDVLVASGHVRKHQGWGSEILWRPPE